MNKKELSERDICTKYITPALEKAGWDIQTQIREEVTFAVGRVTLKGTLCSRGEKRRADYLLSYNDGLPIAVIEAKDNNHSVGAGLQQALEYSDHLDTPFVFSSNGDGFIFHDKTGLSKVVESELTMDQFPSPEALWKSYCQWKQLTAAEQQSISAPFHIDKDGKRPRYYQANAINRTIEAIARGQDRILLVMATGTGKTYTAFQIIWRLWKSKQKKRILFLADRNILVDQTKNNDFKPFGSAMTKITKRQVNKSFQIYLCLYQAVTGKTEEQNIFKQFSPDFFDLIVVDECHRGSAKKNSAWREVLDYFWGASQIGLTATPKETKDVSNATYFGEPVYTYSLKQGIDDGYLAPYKVIRIDIDVDLDSWRPKPGQQDKYGNLIEDRIYNRKDINRHIAFDERTQLVAMKITEYLQQTGEFQKTIVFCDDTDHAESMRRALVNLNPERVAENRKYIMRITGEDKDGKAELDNFINPESRYPVIATTSKLLSTGVDAKTCKLVVLDQNIESMTEFKQIIGRGTRIDEEHDKYWFTIMDFKGATKLFKDEKFDGDPDVIYEPKPDKKTLPPGGVGEPRIKYQVKGENINIASIREQHMTMDGELVTTSLQDHTCDKVKQQFKSLDEFLRKWSTADKKQAIIKELSEQGVYWEELQVLVKEKQGVDMDPFDLICHVVYDQPALTRKERADQVIKRDYFTRYEGQARKVLEALLEKYADNGIEPIEDVKILYLAPFSTLGSPMELIESFGGRQEYQKAVQSLEQEIYASLA
ncbi:DEAD/DEAH box helicase family protein [Endozoicomonas sp. 4G]|uniref:EcoAI/FtnUII family type I restriction enzme subunit R n=1 Tax=Endozoicomonas sp. 4G TaxID=2872754 RepID=UPI0020785024|nr:DEAD/DEAH box helicase family protein [Endozoicomonas sp. 4G]